MSAALFDSHCHLESERFDGDREATLARMAEAGVRACICAGSDMATSEAIVSLAQQHAPVYAAVGVHPHEASSFDEGRDLPRLRAWLALDKVVAVGEIGLDYYYDHSPRDVQKHAFERQLCFAREMGMPAMLHVRDAHGDTLDVLRANRAALPSGVMHCFSGSLDSARAYLDLGFYLSFAGPVTFKNASRLPEVAAFCPADRLLIETDSPYLAPTPMRGRRNEPAFVRFVAERVAEIRGMEASELAALTDANTRRLYGIAQTEAL